MIMARQLLPWTNDWPRGLGTLRREVDGLFDQFFGEGGTPSAQFLPRTNVAETDSGYEVTCELPGLKAEDVEVELHDGHLVIRGEKKHEEEKTEGKTFHRVERSYGQFQRVISLGSGVDDAEVDASFQNGVLTVRVPKCAAVRPKRISIRNE